MLHRRARRFGRLGVDATVADATAAFHDRFVAQGRCPADDRLDGRARASTVA